MSRQSQYKFDEKLEKMNNLILNPAFYLFNYRALN